MTIKTQPSTDPVGTVRRDKQHRLYVRTDEAPPAYWVVIAGPPLMPMWRTPGSLTDTEIVGVVPGTPAAELTRANAAETIPDAAVEATARAIAAVVDVDFDQIDRDGAMSTGRTALEAGLPIATAALHAEVQRLALDVRELRGQRDAMGKYAREVTQQNDALRAALNKANREAAGLHPEPRHQCQDGWIEDANWEPETAEEQREGRRPGSGLLECPTSPWSPADSPGPAAPARSAKAPRRARAGNPSTTSSRPTPTRTPWSRCCSATSSRLSGSACVGTAPTAPAARTRRPRDRRL